MAKGRTIEYYTINTKVLPAIPSSTERYSQLVENWLSKGFRIMYKDDHSHYFTLTTLDKTELNSKTIYYGVVSKFVKIDELDFIDTETGRLVEFELPTNIEARSQQYEFVFIPDFHRFAFIKAGKIDLEIKKRGAPLKQIMNIIKSAFDNGLPEGSKTYVEIEQDSLVFDDIYSNKVLSLEIRVSYTNDDNLNSESKRLMDGMLKDSNIAQMLSRMTPDNNGEIDSSTDLTNGLLGLARQNGEVNALIEDDEGRKRRINTKDHPEVTGLTIDQESATKPNFLNGIIRRFIERYSANDN